MKNKIVLTSLTLSMLGCIQPYQTYQSSTFLDEDYKPSKSEMDSADYGKYPDNFEKIIREKMQNVLLDPESAQYRFPSGKPYKYYTHVKNRQDIQYCWNVMFLVNAKNSYGGYTGEKLASACIRNNQVIAQNILQ